ncbi:carbohydrate ABC transporter permease [Psychromicrobium sp. YIM B11713]|uniref:carbohydrate ABC transporter permease n=1 Tax=Psychromicrobium sp. YIM B11713 TaxID=3145233 RepID=UPI00374E37A2
MTSTVPTAQTFGSEDSDGADVVPGHRQFRRTARRNQPSADSTTRGIISRADRGRKSVRASLISMNGLLLIGLIGLGLGPMLWLAKAAITPTQDTLRTPLALFPHGIDWENLSAAWNDIHISLYFGNTAILAVGAWAIQILVATTGGYLLSILRPSYARVLEVMVLSTLFIPAVVLLVPLYLTILNPPLTGTSMINTYWAVWLPAGANAFNILLVKRFFDSLPREVFEAASTDGAGPFRIFWSLVLPMSKPILGVVSVFAVINSWKDFLWPLLVLPNPQLQPLSVRLPSIQSTTELDVFLAALAISTLIPVMLFIVFQKMFLNSAGLGGALKG